MIRGITFFLLLFVLIHLGITLFRNATNKERWDVIKSLTYSCVLAIITLLVVSFIVVLF